MAGRETFGISMQNNPVQSQSAMQSMRLAYAPDGTAIYKPIGSSSSPPHPAFQGGGGAGVGGGGVSGGAADATSPTMPVHGLNINAGEPVKRKRGRPRKYGPDGTVALALAPVSSAAPMTSGSAGFSPASGATNTASIDPTKKARGRPPGSGKKIQMTALGSPGIGFTPHVITVNTGEDVSSKIMSFSQNGRRAICILSANGAISNVTLRQAASSGGSITYEGRFEILSLSGSFLLTESTGQRSRTGGLSISLAGSDGRVLGGGVAGLLTAASPVQVVVGSFIANGKKDRKQNTALDSASAPGKPAPVGMSGASSPTSRGTLSESSGGPGSPLNQSTGAFNNSNLPGFSNLQWK